MTKSDIVKESDRKWYQKPFWLIGLGILALGSVSNSASVGRFLVLIFIITGFLFLLWLYSVIRITKMNKFGAFTISIITTIILLIVLVRLLDWIKCGGSGSGIFSGRCSRLTNTISPDFKSGKEGLDKY